MTHSRNKSGAFKSECYQVLRNPWLYIAMIAVLGVLISDSYDPLRRTIIGEYPRMYDSPERYSITILFGMLVLLAPIFSSISYAGDIAGIVGFRDTTTGDTLCDQNHPIILESMEFPDPQTR